jgi:uncharacterized protein (DUF2336 family)
MSHQAKIALIDVCDRLRENPTTRARTDTARRVGALLSSAILSNSEYQTALAILEKLVQDVEQDVREALSTHIASCAILPPILARTIAEDIEAISIPFIRVSPALSVSDLLAIVESGNVAKQEAIANREIVTRPVTEALIKTHSATVVTALLRNNGADISEPSFHEIMDDFGGNAAVQGFMVERASLPLTVTERLIEVVSDVLHDRLIERHDLPPEIAVELLNQARECALLHGAAAVPRNFDAEVFANRLRKKGQLTPTLLMRALCLGDVGFFEAGMAVLAGASVPNAITLIADRGPLGFKTLYKRAELPPELFRAFRAALDVLAQLRVGDQGNWSPACVQLILDRVMLEYDEACPADLEYLLSQISRRILGRTDRQGRY